MKLLRPLSLCLLAALTLAPAAATAQPPAATFVSFEDGGFPRARRDRPVCWNWPSIFL